MSYLNIVSFLQQHKKSLLYILLGIGFFLLSTQYGFAVEDGGTLSQEDADKITDILNKAITGAAALMGMVTSFITIFLYPGWVNGTWFGLEEYLKDIWILVSNVVYFIFAFILIAIAFMNIIGKGEGTWELKQAMPKFIIGVLIVPFSWFFVQFVLSISAILTVGILTLPYDSFQGKGLYEDALDSEHFSESPICTEVVISLDGDFSNVEGGADATTTLTDGNADDALDENIRCMEGSKLTVRELLTGENKDGEASAEGAALQSSIFGIINIYSYGILRIHELDTIGGNQLQHIKTIADLIFKIVFDLLFVAVYLLLMIALMLALFARGVRLWIYAMLSPLFGILYFMDKTGKEGFSSDTKFSIGEFVSLALVPVYVAAALAFGLTFIMLASAGIPTEGDGSDTLKAGGFSLTITGAVGDNDVETSVIGKLIVQIFGVAILWIAVMAALKSSETTQQITAPIAKFGEQVGELAAQAPTYAPIIPTPHGNMSAASMPLISNAMKTAVDEKVRERGKDFIEGSGIDGSAGSVDSNLRNDINNLNTRISGEQTIGKENVQKFNNLMGRFNGDVAAARQHRDMQELIKTLGDKLGVEVEDRHFRNNNGFAELLRELHNESLDASKGPLINGLGNDRATQTNVSSGALGGFFGGTQQNQQNPPGGNPPNTTQNINFNINGTTQQQIDTSKFNFSTDNSGDVSVTGGGLNEIKSIVGQNNINSAQSDSQLKTAIENGIKTLQIPDDDGDLQDITREQVAAIMKALGL